MKTDFCVSRVSRKGTVLAFRRGRVPVTSAGLVFASQAAARTQDNIQAFLVLLPVLCPDLNSSLSAQPTAVKSAMKNGSTQKFIGVQTTEVLPICPTNGSGF